MKAMVLKEYGENADFHEVDTPKPSPAAGQVLVRVAASSVNTVDTMIRQLGQEQLPLSPDLPAVLGMDFAGTVETVGEGVSGFAPGDEVYGCAGGLLDLQGALAEYMPADVRLIAHKPKSLNMREAAALPLVGITAQECLDRAAVKAGQTVLVHGGAGGVGHVATQLAVQLGANVHATVSGDDKAQIVRQYGATPIDYQAHSVESYVKQHTDGAGFQVIIDTIGAENLRCSFEAAALNAQIATTVSLLELDLTAMHFKGLSLHVIFMLIPMLHDTGREEHGRILTRLARHVEAGELKPLLDEMHFTLQEVGAAHERLTSGRAVGKVVVEV